MFETLAVLTTLSLIAIFIVLVRMELNGRRDDNGSNGGPQ